MTNLVYSHWEGIVGIGLLVWDLKSIVILKEKIIIRLFFSAMTFTIITHVEKAYLSVRNSLT